MLLERATGHIKKRGDRIAAFSPPLNLNLNYEKLVQIYGSSRKFQIFLEFFLNNSTHARRSLAYWRSRTFSP